MKINNEFTVHAPIERAWALLTDVEAIAPCMPGAQLTGIRPADAGEALTGEVYEGKVKVKLGPVVAEYKGTAAFSEKDDAAYRGVIDAKGRDSRGAGNASALITVQLRPEGGGTTVAIDTDLKISGKIAQFGASMIQEVSEKLLGQFVGCLESKLAEPSTIAPVTAPPAAPPSAAAVAAALSLATATETPTPAATTTPTETPTPAGATTPAAPAPAPVRRAFQAPPEPEALDLLDLAGGSAFKRLLPIVIAGVAAVAAVIFFLTRR